MIFLLQSHASRFHFLQKRFGQSVKGGYVHALGPLTRNPYHPRLELPGRFSGESKTENALARKVGIGFEQVAYALRDDASLPGAGSGNDQQRTIAVGDGSLLSFIRLQAGGRERADIKQRQVPLIRVTKSRAKRKRNIAGPEVRPRKKLIVEISSRLGPPRQIAATGLAARSTIPNFHFQQFQSVFRR